jgi:hypothetical protein
MCQSAYGLYFVPKSLLLIFQLCLKNIELVEKYLAE